MAELRLPEEILAARTEGRLSVAFDRFSRGLLDRFSTGQGIIVIVKLGQWFLSSQAFMPVERITKETPGS